MPILNKLKKMDWTIVAILLVFMVCSFFTLYSAVLPIPSNAGLPNRQLIYYIIGFIVMFGISLFNYRFILKCSPFLYLISVISLIAVYFFGAEINSAKGWFIIPGINQSIQPAEFAKIFIILFISYVLGSKGGKPLGFIRDVVPILLIVLLPFLFVVIQPDLGNAMVYLVILAGVLWIANMKWLHILFSLILIGGTIFGGIQLLITNYDSVSEVLQKNGAGHWMDRIDAFIFPEKASSDQTYQIDNAYIAIGSGSLLGEGYQQGTSVQKPTIPYTYSDSIFVVIAEEFGFLGSSLLMLLYFFLIYRLINIAMRCKEHSGAYIIVGIISMFVFQIYQNIGMFLKLLPITGITLPFISYGGSSLLINMIAISIALSIQVHTEHLDEYRAYRPIPQAG